MLMAVGVLVLGERLAPAQKISSDSMPRPSRPRPENTEPFRKEVIQPHLPVRLPCYDFVPITGPAFDRSPWGHGLRAETLRPTGRATSGVTGMRFRTGDSLLAMDVVDPQ